MGGKAEPAQHLSMLRFISDARHKSVYTRKYAGSGAGAERELGAYQYILVLLLRNLSPATHVTKFKFLVRFEPFSFFSVYRYFVRVAYHAVIIRYSTLVLVDDFRIC